MNTPYFKAFCEGEDRGMHAGSYWDKKLESVLTDEQIEVIAHRYFKQLNLTFESDFDARMAFVAGYWQGWRKGIAPYKPRESEKATAESWGHAG